MRPSPSIPPRSGSIRSLPSPTTAGARFSGGKASLARPSPTIRKPSGWIQRCSAYCGRGLALAEKGELDKAIIEYTEAVRLDPKYAKAYCNRGGVMRGRAIWIRPSPITRRPSGLIRNLRAPIAERGKFCWQKGERTRPSPTSRKRSGLIRKMLGPMASAGPSIGRKASWIWPLPITRTRFGLIRNLPSPMRAGGTLQAETRTGQGHRRLLGRYPA